MMVPQLLCDIHRLIPVSVLGMAPEGFLQHLCKKASTFMSGTLVIYHSRQFDLKLNEKELKTWCAPLSQHRH